VPPWTGARRTLDPARARVRHPDRCRHELVLFLFLIIWLQSAQYKDQFPGHDTKAFALAVASAFLFVLSILLHELGHAAVAIRNGIGISGIDLWMFGGRVEDAQGRGVAGRRLQDRRGGPLVTFLITALCFGIGAASVARTGSGGCSPSRTRAARAPMLVGDICFINGLLLVFNLLPGLPLDGGRMLRAIVWWRTGDRNRATRVMPPRAACSATSSAGSASTSPCAAT